MLLIAMSDSAMQCMSRKAVDLEWKDSSRKGRRLKFSNLTCIHRSTITLTMRVLGVIMDTKLNMNSSSPLFEDEGSDN